MSWFTADVPLSELAFDEGRRLRPVSFGVDRVAFLRRWIDPPGGRGVGLVDERGQAGELRALVATEERQQVAIQVQRGELACSEVRRRYATVHTARTQPVLATVVPCDLS